jgi:hypothetical protein
MFGGLKKGVSSFAAFGPSVLVEEERTMIQ